MVSEVLSIPPAKVEEFVLDFGSVSTVCCLRCPECLVLWVVLWHLNLHVLVDFPLQYIDLVDDFLQEGGRRALMFFCQEAEVPGLEGKSPWYFLV